VKLKVYLSGRMDVDWRGALIDECFKPYLDKLHFINPSEIEQKIYGDFVIRDDWFYPVNLDLFMVDNSHLVIAIFFPPEVKYVPIGTSAEVFYAYLKKKPIITLVPEELRHHPWLKQMSTMILTIPFLRESFPLFHPVFPEDVKKKLTAFIETFIEAHLSDMR